MTRNRDSFTPVTNTSSIDPGRRRMVGGAAAAGIAAAVLPLAARAQPKQVNVGVILPLSGANAQFGINSRNGIELVADEINASGGIKALGGARINLIIADGTSTPTTAASVAQRLISQNEVVAILGAFASNLTIAISEVTERRGIPLMTMSFADQITGRGFKNVFQVVSKASVIGRAQFDYALQIARAAGEKVERAAVMYEDTAYGTSQATGLRAAAKEANVQLVMDDAYPLGITDVTPLIARLRTSGAQMVFPVSYLNDSLMIIRTMRQQQIDIPAIGGAAGYVIPDFVKGLGEFSEGVMSVSPANHDTTPELTDRFRKRFGYFMVHEALEHATCMGVLAEALEIAGSIDGDKLRDTLRKTTFTRGWSAAMTPTGVKFDETGLNTMASPVMVQWQKGELVTIWPKNQAKAPARWKNQTV
jgi:branched-chain amino acid transport system substrate-binding protein